MTLPGEFARAVTFGYMNGLVGVEESRPAT